MTCREALLKRRTFFLDLAAETIKQVQVFEKLAAEYMKTAKGIEVELALMDEREEK